MREYVVLINEKNEVIGTAPKRSAHTKQTPLHRGFSVFLFNQAGEVLLQQRGKQKKTWPLVWSNSCCGHPRLEESPEQAAQRRISYELGITDAKIQVILPHYQYRFERNHVVENEICPVMVAISNQQPRIKKEEVEAVAWMDWKQWVALAKKKPEDYSEWSIEETALLLKSGRFHQFFRDAVRKLPSK